ncbi:hypothetical protein RRG08_034425 [Elysia crispata]|uniref:Uncharacterized protein n=1 Tax=Elysia crispata TaxID=231223 RepID=A0AAE0YD07_9GAST|nr:hypothetical protein RRG08_034425 [Elysia crispata]
MTFETAGITTAVIPHGLPRLLGCFLHASDLSALDQWSSKVHHSWGSTPCGAFSALAIAAKSNGKTAVIELPAASCSGRRCPRASQLLGKPNHCYAQQTGQQRGSVYRKQLLTRSKLKIDVLLQMCTALSI